MPKRFKWVVEFTIDETWVADGFDPDDEQMHDMLARNLTSALNWQFDAKVLKRPPDKEIAKAQGYPSVKQYRASNWNGKVRK